MERPFSTDNITDAKTLLATTSWFQNEALQQALAMRMIRMEVEDGHVFLWEGRQVDAILIIEEGTLRRSKAVDSDQLDSIIEETETEVNITSSTRSLKTEDDEKWSILVDEISGKGRVTGLLHVLNNDFGAAYATVKSFGTATIWMIPAQDFLDVISNDTSFALEMLKIVAYKMRAGSKSLKGMVANAKTMKHSASIIGEERITEANPIVKVLCYDSTQWVKPSFTPIVEKFNSEAEAHGCSIKMDFTNDRLSKQSAPYSAG